jgi:hypothetical protein
MSPPGSLRLLLGLRLRIKEIWKAKLAVDWRM